MSAWRRMLLSINARCEREMGRLTRESREETASMTFDPAESPRRPPPAVAAASPLLLSSLLECAGDILLPLPMMPRLLLSTWNGEGKTRLFSLLLLLLLPLLCKDLLSSSSERKAYTCDDRCFWILLRGCCCCCFRFQALLLLLRLLVLLLLPGRAVINVRVLRASSESFSCASTIAYRYTFRRCRRLGELSLFCCFSSSCSIPPLCSASSPPPSSQLSIATTSFFANERSGSNLMRFSSSAVRIWPGCPLSTFALSIVWTCMRSSP
mmetsp:Transcript_43416/g.69885  ORF Transcript_43416/g.69885 Transcript_43416/m.69885 type:complete len:267 (+) Transcript_43416:375-1175(+)